MGKQFLSSASPSRPAIAAEGNFERALRKQTKTPITATHHVRSLKKLEDCFGDAVEHAGYV
jgi:hypothetical protein